MKTRKPLPFDTSYFKKRPESSGASPRDIFTHIYKTNHWAGESRSGAGSSRDQTAVIERELPGLLRHLGIKSLLDLPCGDFGWLSRLVLPIDQYIGGDIVPELVEVNQQRYGSGKHRFLELNLLTDPLPAAGLLFCRDCLVHLSNTDVQKALQNISRSQIAYLATTTFTECELNEDITTGDWRVINLEKAPFLLPPPLLLINEQCTEGDGTYADKSLAVWEVSSLPRL